MNIKKADSVIEELHKIYSLKKKEIISRLKEFSKIWDEGTDEDIFTELAFCLLTPQSKAKSCWEAVLTVKGHDLLLKGTADEIKHRLYCVRFHNRKAQYIVKARRLFLKDGKISIRPLLKRFADIHECREWLVKNLTGLGYKEASHFLRNVGLGENIAILDRHILRNLSILGVIEEIPESLNRTKYLRIENDMWDFAKRIGIPLSHLDLLLWYKETGEIFK